MMMKKSLLFAVTLAALTFVGNSAQAAFSISTVLTSTNTPATALTLVANNIANAPVPTPEGGISFNFLDIQYAGSSATVGPVTFTVTGTFNVNNGGVMGSGSFSQELTYTLVNGFGSLKAGAASITPFVAGINFAPILFAAPTLNDGNPSTGNLSTNLTAVPEPASVAMLGLGLASLGGLALRRRSAK